MTSYVSYASLCACPLSDLDPPRDFREVRSMETSLAVAWQKPQAKVGGYRLAYMSRDGQAEQVEIPASESTYVLPNLIPGMSYTLTLAAERGHRRSKPVSLTASTGGSPQSSKMSFTDGCFLNAHLFNASFCFSNQFV